MSSLAKDGTGKTSVALHCTSCATSGSASPASKCWSRTKSRNWCPIWRNYIYFFSPRPRSEVNCDKQVQCRKSDQLDQSIQLGRRQRSVDHHIRKTVLAWRSASHAVRQEHHRVDAHRRIKSETICSYCFIIRVVASNALGGPVQFLPLLTKIGRWKNEMKERMDRLNPVHAIIMVSEYFLVTKSVITRPFKL